MQFPQVASAAKLAGLLIKHEQEFGLTPSARSRIEVDRRFTQGSKETSEFRRKFLDPLPAAPPSPMDEEIKGRRREHRKAMGEQHDGEETG